MKKALKYTLATLAAAAVAAPVYASGHIVDNLAISGAATFTEASNNGLHVGNSLITADYWRPLFLEPDHGWDYSLGLTYRIPGHNTRVFFEYDHFNDTTDRTFSNINALATAPGGVGSVVSGSVNYKDQDFRFGLRHTLEFGPKFEMVLGGAIEYARIQRTFNVQFPNIVPANGRFGDFYDESEGWGPFVDALGRAFPFGDENRCWSFWAHAGVGLLYGNNDSHARITNGLGAFPAGTDYSYDPEDTRGVFTRVEADMGIEWNRVMRADFADMRLGIRLGLKYLNYINGFKSGNLFQSPAGGGLVAMNTSPDDFSRMGGFLQLTLGGGNS